MSNPLPVFQPLAPPGAEHVVEVAFKGNRRAFYTTADENIREGDHVIVAAERGEDLGRVKSVGGVARSKCSSTSSEAGAAILRRAEPEEVRQAMVLRSDEERVRRQTRELVDRHDLKMKVSEAEWQWDRNKLTIYFTAERRVDFRELVRELARTFRTRIELKQIGVRDEAALLGGLGRCGRQLCCATWLREIRPVSLQLAKDQNLSLNPSQISGTCGRLMCCLTYEHDAYIQARKRFPREGKVLQTAKGAEKVIGIDIWRESVMLMDENRQRRSLTLSELKQELAPTPPARRERPAAAEPAEPAAVQAADDAAPVGDGRRRARPERRRGVANPADPELGISELLAANRPRPAAGRREPSEPAGTGSGPAVEPEPPAAPSAAAPDAEAARPGVPKDADGTQPRGRRKRPPRKPRGASGSAGGTSAPDEPRESAGPEGAPEAAADGGERSGRPRRRRGRRGGGSRNG